MADRTEARRAVRAAIPSAGGVAPMPAGEDNSGPQLSSRKRGAQDTIVIACTKVGATVQRGREASQELQQLCHEYPQLEYVAAHQVFAKHIGRVKNIDQAMQATKAELARRAPAMARRTAP